MMSVFYFFFYQKCLPGPFRRESEGKSLKISLQTDLVRILDESLPTDRIPTIVRPFPTCRITEDYIEVFRQRLLMKASNRRLWSPGKMMWWLPIGSERK